MQSFEALTGQARSEHLVDVQAGDMFWDLAPLNDGSVLALHHHLRRRATPAAALR